MVISDQALALTLRIVPFSSVSCGIAIAGMTIETMPFQIVSTHNVPSPGTRILYMPTPKSAPAPKLSYIDGWLITLFRRRDQDAARITRVGQKELTPYGLDGNGCDSNLKEKLIGCCVCIVELFI